jgi:hypothetical protein
MGYVIFGHGGLDLTSQDMEWVAVPWETTIQFYSDAGQSLLQRSEAIVDVFTQMLQPWPPIDHTGVTYNLALEPFSAKQLEHLLKDNPDFGGHTLLVVGRDIPTDKAWLCTGTKESCPTDPRDIAAGWTHGCDGILASYPGELHWLACTSLPDDASADAVRLLTDARGDAIADVALGQDPDDAAATARVLLATDPDGFGEWFDQLSEADRQIILEDPTIDAWYRSRT